MYKELIPVFETIEEAKRQILRDKHTLLEGYVSEYLFEQQFFNAGDIHYTNGWWSAMRGNHRYFFLVKSEMNVVDQRVFNILSQQYECWVAYPEGNDWKFSNGNARISEADFIREHSFSIIRTELAATTDTRNTERQNRCVAFFEEKNIIRKIAIERNFADDFLTKYFNSMVNIDYISQNATGNLCVMEVKFKYENRAGNFGINAGQVLMFSILEELGFEIHHMILYNHTKNKDLSVFGFLDLPDDKFWLYGQLSGFADRRMSVAPRETSVDGRSEQSYYSFGRNELSRRFSLVLR